MAKKAKKAKLPPIKKLPNDEPVKLDMSFQEALKLALNTPTKASKAKK